MDVLAYVAHADLYWFLRLQAWTPPRWFRATMIGLTRLGDGWAYLGLVPLGQAVGPSWRVLAAGCLAAALGNALMVTVKHTVRRPRPCELAPQTRVALRPPDRWSFPSGHAANAFTIGTLIALVHPAATPLCLGLAAGVAASRVVLGMHFVSDVLAGSLLGAAVAAVAWELLLR